MDVQTILNGLGSIASIGAIPLSIFLYLRAQEEKLAGARRDILRTLSYQLGEGRSVTLFEIEAVTESVLRVKRLKGSPVSPVEVVNDLVSETISNPMISRERKEEILFELQRALLSPSIRHIVLQHRLTAPRLAILVGDAPQSRSELEAKTEAIAVEHDAKSHAALTSTLFGLVAAVTSSVVAAFEFSDLTPRLREMFERLPASPLILGVLTTILAALVSLGLNKFNIGSHKDESTGRRRSDETERPNTRLRPTVPDEDVKRRG